MGQPRNKPVTLARRVARDLAKIPTQTLDGPGAPTPERLMQAGLAVALQLGTGRVQIIGRKADAAIGADGVIRLAQATLDRLHARGQLDEADPARNQQLFEAGDKLRNHHYLAGLSGFAANDPLHSGGGGHPSNRLAITEVMESNRRALYRAEAAMDPGDWLTVRDVTLTELTLADAGRGAGFGNRAAAQAVALGRLRRGLSRLAELWGYLPPPRPPTAPAAANDGGARAVSTAA